MFRASMCCLLAFISIAIANIPVAEEECMSFVQLERAKMHRMATGRARELPIEGADYWPSARGAVGRYSSSPYKAVFDISAPSWSWHHPDDLWATIAVGTAIDDQKNIYLTVVDGILKFTQDGKLLWMYPTQDSEEISDAAALMGSAVYCVTTAGRAFAVSKETGTQLWSTKISQAGADGTDGSVNAHDGVVITAANSSAVMNRITPGCCGPSNHEVVGLNGTNGKILWKFQPDKPVWNFGCTFVGDGTFVYQDLEGRVYRNSVHDGSLVWKAGGVPESWTDGQANLGSNGIVYGVANYGMALLGTHGFIAAHRLSDGELLWKHDVPKSPNSIPAIGLLAGQAKLSVVIPIGQNDVAGCRIDVYALDAETGKEQWIFKGPTQTQNSGAGDNAEVRAIRQKHHVPTSNLPNSWGTAAIDGEGTVFVGGTTGDFFALRDANGDGSVDGHDNKEVSKMSTGAGFVGSSGPALAPGLLAVGSANSLFVYTYPTE